MVSSNGATCSLCGAPLDGGATICRECATVLGEEDAPVAPPVPKQGDVVADEALAKDRLIDSIPAGTIGWMCITAPRRLASS